MAEKPESVKDSERGVMMKKLDTRKTLSLLKTQHSCYPEHRRPETEQGRWAEGKNHNLKSNIGDERVCDNRTSTRLLALL